ncbi:MAG: DUF3418 domain-containing protein [Candidatus Latescibacteria bacterium]|nr:DUF3418 domain-containing protein [Candidatus Latescibacterota bacterium]
MAAEIVETSRIFARTAAAIERGWIAEMGEHLCRASYRDPHWNPRSGRVLVTETLTLYGLQVQQRRVPYRRVNPTEATDIFIREALVNDTLRARHPFLLHNRQVRARVETWQMASRPHRDLDLDQAVHRFYAERLEDVSSVHDLNRHVRRDKDETRDLLLMKETDLTGDEDFELDRDAFPDHLSVDGERLVLSYAYRPGQDEDGVTLKLPFKLVHFVRPEVLEWLVPGLLQEKITHLLRGLPKGKRKQFVPVPETAREIATSLRPTHGSLLASLEAHLLERYGMEVQRSDWRQDDVPEHLRIRIEVQGNDGQLAAAGRDLEALVDGLNEREPPAESRAWRTAASEWERDDLTDWNFGDPPERVEVTAVGGLPVYGHPGLKAEGDRVHLRLFATAGESEAESRTGLIRFGELRLRREMKALRGELRELGRIEGIAYYQQGAEGLLESAYAHLVAHLFEVDDVLPLTQDRFEQLLDQARDRLQGLVPRFLNLMGAILGCYAEARSVPSPYPDMESDLTRLVPPDFLSQIPFRHLSRLARYLKAVHLRAERARLSPGSDRRKLEQVQPFQDELDRLHQPEDPPRSQQRRRIDEFRWMLEEYRVSVFAQELGTAHPVSAKRLNAKLDEIRQPA